MFKAVGPIMIGPSSSHTAGAARLARIARLIVAAPFSHVCFALHGSFAKTYRGHGTDRALVAGALGLREDDERLADSFALARRAGLSWEFTEADLGGMHENSVRMTFTLTDGSRQEITGSSIGGGQIVIRSINGFETEYSAQSSALIIRQYDRPGVVSEVSGVLAGHGINIAVMRVSRSARGETAFCIIETDDWIPREVEATLRELPNIISVRAINLIDREESTCTAI
ncbi:L-serine ammonia-lyase, iron-sulfur-dependent subunit beta [Yanshouia hominis]|uniref:L-serine ammonia-lyase, iron-sulfur-dependent subunit beta n=1 Tax=Yanshouia hominis TaxID=2763673 RepID=UPI0021CCACBA|nr:L-serine ammonia-lyase, iron-sulfur-dependent subunit beta [Yanshouia hominis]